jgi:outer membrane protein assembly factor BamE
MPQLLVCSVLVLLLAGCAFDPERTRLMNERYPSYPEEIKRAIDHGYLIYGMTADQAYLALGPPHCKAAERHDNKTVETWMYPPDEGFPCTRASNKVFFDKGSVIGWKFTYTK